MASHAKRVHRSSLNEDKRAKVDFHMRRPEIFAWQANTSVTFLALARPPAGKPREGCPP
jgi:hypothetical protein